MSPFLFMKIPSIFLQSVMQALPPQLRGELAAQLHMETLRRVELLADVVESSLLQELVLRLKMSMFAPNDYLCHAGDVAKVCEAALRASSIHASKWIKLSNHFCLLDVLKHLRASLFCVSYRCRYLIIENGN